MELTVSKALDFLTCPLRYQRRYILGIPEPEPEWEDYPPDEEDGTSAANVGSAAHQILRSVDFTKDISPQLEEYARYQDEAVRDTALESCRRLLNSPWLSRIQSGSSWLQEVPFQAHLDQLRLLGRIDLLFKDQSGWIIIDYKTGSGEGGERYNLQVGIYALAIERCLGVAPMKVALVNLGKGEDVEINVTAELLDQTRRLLEAIPLAVRSGAFPARKSSECDYCGYGKGCQLTVDG
ncbi:MAG: PD-(D/E)XK nuclease family protein [Armatimonadota bacterium]|nr:PD-(D/E)XK nuclease family protein [Armatimonadota bacterium]